MLVYGDRSRTCDPRRMLTELARAMRALDGVHGTERHDGLTGALIHAGELAQGLADAEFDAAGFDHPSPIQSAAMSLCVAIARRQFRDGPSAEAEVAALAGMPLPPTIRSKTPEGYAFYAVYPKSYFATARAYPWPDRPLILGLRSIGTSLAAAVAAATGGRAISLRPCGHPFAREIRVSAALRTELGAHSGPFAIVDEGPGLSGSSFGAVADLLEGLGVAPRRMVFLPSHANGLGPQASPRHRARWAAAERPVQTFDDLVGSDPPASWFADLIGPAVRVDDLSAGAWRCGRPRDARPPVIAAQERRKYRLVTADGAYLARFAGLGAIGAAKHARARVLAAEGFVPEPLALRGGFLLERWVEGAGADPHGPERPRFLAHLGRYLRCRAGRLPADAQAGASLDALCEMAAVNLAELFGEAEGRRFAAPLDGLAQFADELRPVHVDARLQPWEWLRRPDGTFCKTDALDHSEAHDLVGCQDIAWDLAGAAVEYQLTADEIARLSSAVVDGAGRARAGDLIAGLEVCYAALQAGAWTMAETSADAAERHRIRRRRELYVARLRQIG